METVHLEADGVVEILIRNARQSQRTHDHGGARQDHCRNRMTQPELAQEVRVSGSPHSGRLAEKITDGQGAGKLRAGGAHASRGNAQRLAAARSDDLNSYPAAEGGKLLQPGGHHWTTPPGTMPP